MILHFVDSWGDHSLKKDLPGNSASEGGDFNFGCSWTRAKVREALRGKGLRRGEARSPADALVRQPSPKRAQGLLERNDCPVDVHRWSSRSSAHYLSFSFLFLERFSSSQRFANKFLYFSTNLPAVVSCAIWKATCAHRHWCLWECQLIGRCWRWWNFHWYCCWPKPPHRVRLPKSQTRRRVTCHRHFGRIASAPFTLSAGRLELKTERAREREREMPAASLWKDFIHSMPTLFARLLSRFLVNSLPPVRGPPHLLEQVVSSLLRVAFTFKPPCPQPATCPPFSSSVRSHQQQSESVSKMFTWENLPKPNVIFVLGGPGAGKGTQCSLICRVRRTRRTCSTPCHLNLLPSRSLATCTYRPVICCERNKTRRAPSMVIWLLIISRMAQLYPSRLPVRCWRITCWSTWFPLLLLSLVMSPSRRAIFW